MKKCLLLLFTLGMLLQANAQLASWNFNGSTLNPTFEDPDITASPATSVGLGGTTQFFTCNMEAWSPSGWNETGAVNINTDYAEYSIIADVGCTMVITSFGFNAQRSGTGPANYEVRASVDLYASVQVGGTVPTSCGGVGGAFASPINIGAGGTATFRIYGYNATGSGGNMRMDDVTISGATSCSLPVELSSFTSKTVDKRSVLLEWATESEDNNSFFAIEHSTNGFDFYDLDLVPGAGTSYFTQFYSYLHQSPVKGSNYYRLRQTDFDGAFSYSPVEVVEMRRQLRLSVNPTLAHNNIEVSVADEFDAVDGTIELLDLNGRQLMIRPFNGDNRQRMNISDLPDGHYMIRVSSDRNSEIARFVKRN